MKTVTSYSLEHEGKEVFTHADINQIYFKLQRTQSQSAEWAIKYEGWRVYENYTDGTRKDISNA